MTTSTNFHIPDDRYYDGANHLWAKIDSTTGRVIIGIDELGLQALGDLVYITLKEVGTPVKRGEAVGTLEAAKMTGDIIAPASGILIGRNESVLRDPTLVNRDPYDTGWIVSLDPTNWKKESTTLVFGAAIPEWLAAEVERYRKQGWI
jgi:glycine cleavage system H protein